MSQAWIREAPPGATVMAGYAKLHNAGKQPLTLDGAVKLALDTVRLGVKENIDVVD